MRDVEEVKWHPEVLPDSAHVVLLGLGAGGILSGFYLAGGTGLALQFGHRRSIDLDFFSTNPFDVELLTQQLQKLGGISLISKGVNTLHIALSGVKISFLGYEYPLLFPLLQFGAVGVADWRDITCMKMSALAGRGTRRDFVDLHASAQRCSLSLLVDQFKKKYSRVNYSLFHVLKSLTYFEDADREEMPTMVAPVQWDEVKRFFQSEAPKLTSS